MVNPGRFTAAQSERVSPRSERLVGTQDELGYVFAQMPEALEALQKVAEERLLDKFDASLGGAKTSDGTGSGSADGDVAGPLTFSRGSGKGGSLVGGGEKTLPPGFADAVSTSIGNVLDEVSIDRERTQAVEKRVAALESSVARGFMTVTAQLEQIAARLDASAAAAALVPTTLPSPRHHAAAATTVAGDATGGAAGGRDGSRAVGALAAALRTRFALCGHWLDVSDSSTSCDPYVRLCRLPPVAANGKPAAVPLEVLEDFFPDERRVVWTSEVRRHTNNPGWDTVTLDSRDLGGGAGGAGGGSGGDAGADAPLLLQCWNWQRSKTPHEMIGACTTTLRQLLAASEYTPLALRSSTRQHEVAESGGTYGNSGTITVSCVDG